MDAVEELEEELGKVASVLERSQSTQRLDELV